MKINSYIFLFLTFPVSLLFAQKKEDWNYSSKWQLNPSVVYDMPLTKINNGTITDNFIGYANKNTVYSQLPTIVHFFDKHWGIEAKYQLGITSTNRSFSDSVQAAYQDRYYVFSSNQNNNSNYLKQRLLVGAVYRIEKNRFFVYPKLSLGYTSFPIDNGSAILKEMNANTMLKINYSPNTSNVYSLTIAPTVTAGFKVTKHLFFSADVMPSYYKPNVTFIKTTTDLSTNQNTVEKIHYNKGIFALSLGASIVFAMGR